MKYIEYKLRGIIRKSNFLSIVFDYLIFIKKHRRIPKKDGSSFNDYLFYVKRHLLSDPLRQFITDKEYVKYYIASKVGNLYNIKTIAVYSDPMDLIGKSFLVDVVIKPTHLSKEVVFLESGSTINGEIAALAKGWMKKNLFDITGEINYKYLRPKIIVEERVPFDGGFPKDYKFFVYQGNVFLIQVDLGRYEDHKRLFLDEGWNKQPFSIGFEVGPMIAKPDNLSKLKELAVKLAEPLDFLRVDLYTDGQKIYVGELTNLHDGANSKFLPSDNYDWVLGSMMRSL